MGPLADAPRVVVLGATGFVGSWVLRSLLGSGIDATAVVRPSSPRWRLENIRRLRVVEAEEERWAEAILGIAPNCIVSLDWAGVAGADRDDEAQWSNLDRLQRVLDAAANCGTERFVGIGSQAEYGPQSIVIRETTLAEPRTVYAKAKLAALELVNKFCDRHDLDWAWGRIFSTYGPLDNTHWLLPQIAEALLAGRDIDLSEGTQAWSYLYGSDAGDAIALLAVHPEAGGIYNIGNPSAPQLRSTIELFATAFDSSSRLNFGAIPFGQDSVRRLEPDVSRLARLGWQSRVPYSTGLSETAAWWRGNPVVDPFDPDSSLPAHR